MSAITKPERKTSLRLRRPSKEPAPPRLTLREKWGAAIDAGFVVVPSVLIRAQSRLGLDAIDLAIVLNIMMHWWRNEDLPYPRPVVIARRIGVSTRTVERRLEALQGANLIDRLAAERSKDQVMIRRYDLSGLVKRLEAFAEANLESRNKQDEDIDI